MEQVRRVFSSQEKVKILREHLIEKVPISQVCEKYQIQPALFYTWQKVFFENGTAAFERQPSHPRASLEGKKIAQLEQKLQRKDEVLAELMSEHIMLKKSLGEI
jgi:transposase